MDQREGKSKGEQPHPQHRIYAAITQHQAEHQATVVESASIIFNIPLSLLINSGATDSVISSFALIRCRQLKTRMILGESKRLLVLNNL